mmetsp:Transcript_45325/g.114045  ORF Transcript_45325/g.114045 Transcript_45325/m.114045 type:complete len:242 (-) Transcript_45325:644-1369(-)
MPCLGDSTRGPNIEEPPSREGDTAPPRAAALAAAPSLACTHLGGPAPPWLPLLGLVLPPSAPNTGSSIDPSQRKGLRELSSLRAATANGDPDPVAALPDGALRLNALSAVVSTAGPVVMWSTGTASPRFWAMPPRVDGLPREGFPRPADSATTAAGVCCIALRCEPSGRAKAVDEDAAEDDWPAREAPGAALALCCSPNSCSTTASPSMHSATQSKEHRGACGSIRHERPRLAALANQSAS